VRAERGSLPTHHQQASCLYAVKELGITGSKKGRTVGKADPPATKGMGQDCSKAAWREKGKR